ncbi:MAG TPA: hypothetical protein VF148_13050 [Acidimicrobiia bacterium]
MTLDDRIRINLDSAASSVPGAEPSPIDRIKSKARARRRRRQAGLGLGILVLVVGTVLLSNTDATDIYLADGERLIGTSPPIVAGAESPPVEFDTSELGEEAPLTPVTNIDRILQQARRPDGQIIRVTVLGETPEGRLALIVHSEMDDPELGRLQERCLTAEGSGASCGGEKIEDTVDMPGGLIPLEPGTGPTFTTGEDAPVDSALMWAVPPETAAVALIVNRDQVMWQRPVGNVAVFDTSLQDGDSFQLTAYDSEGNVVDLWP